MKNKKINSENLIRGRPNRMVRQDIRKNRPFHKKVMLHPITMLLVLAIGVLVFEWTYRVIADTITITASVPAAPLTTPAVITSPTNGFTFNNQNIVVEGYCPDGSYVNVYDNGLFGGTSMCTTGGTFQLQLSLYLGENILVARPYNVTNQPGPNSSDVDVTYMLPATAIPPTTPVLPLLLVSSFQYQTFGVNNTFSWQVQIKGGKPPITLTINWGDGKQSQVITDAHGYLNIKHNFSQQGYYPVIVKATDANGTTHILQLAALIRNPNSANIFSTNYTLPTPTASGLMKFFETARNWLWVAWPSLVILGLMIASFWLGERQEYRDTLFHHHRGA
jgi:hypothetical protein